MMEAIIKKAPAKKVAVKKVAVTAAARLKKVAAKEAVVKFVDKPLKLDSPYWTPQISVAYPDPNNREWVIKLSMNLEFAQMPTQFGCAQIGMPSYKQLLGWTLTREHIWQTEKTLGGGRRFEDVANVADAVIVLAEHVIDHFRHRVVVPGFSQMAIVGINGREHKDSVAALGLEPLTEIMAHLEKYDGQDIKFDIKMIEFQNQVHTERSGGPKSRVWLYTATCL